MTQVGEGVAITQIQNPDEDHWAQLEYTYPDGSPVQGLFSAVDGSGMTWASYLNDQGQACLSGLPPGQVEFELLPSESLDDELKDLQAQIQTVLDGIIEEQHAEAKEHEEALAQQSALRRGYSHYQAVRRGFWNGALGLLTFGKDVALKLGEAAYYASPINKLNNMLSASYTSYANGELTWDQWRQSLAKNYRDEQYQDLAKLLGFDVRNLDKGQVLGLMTEAYEITAYIAADAEFRGIFVQFGKDYAGAQSSIEWAEFAGGGLFEIVLTALLLAFTGGLGNAAQAASKVRHAGRLRSLGGLLRKLGKLLQRKKLSKKTKGGVDSTHKVKADRPEGQKLSSGAKDVPDKKPDGATTQVGGAPDKFGDVYAKAPAAKLEIDKMADEIAVIFGGQVAKAPIKSQERAIQKIVNDYGGDATRIKDLARNTIIVSPDKMDSVVAELAKRGASVKVIDGATDPLGYSGVNSTIKTQPGVFGEIQVNTPAMIYAKEPESMARALLGDNLYGSMAAKSGIPGGRGHKFYEQWRVLPSSDPGRSALEAQSKAYYDTVRNSVYGN